jgi:hypothetical protein
VFYGWNGAAERRFCVVDRTGSLDPATCTVIDRGNLAWDGAAFRLYGRADAETMFLRSFDGSGRDLGEVRLPNWWPNGAGGATPYFLPEAVALVSEAAREGSACRGYVLDTIGRSLDPGSHRQWDLLNPDFTLDAFNVSAWSGTRLAVLYGGLCRLRPTWVNWDPYIPCEVAWPNTFTLFLTLVVVGARPSLSYDRGDQVTSSRLAAIGPNDYVVVYRSMMTGGTRIARLSTIPL